MVDDPTHISDRERIMHYETERAKFMAELAELQTKYAALTDSYARLLAAASKPPTWRPAELTKFLGFAPLWGGSITVTNTGNRK